MTNTFKTEITSDGYVETLVWQGKEYTKRYVRTEYGSRGLDQSFEYEMLPDNLIEALEGGEVLDIMDALKFADDDFEDEEEES
ncbi:hypothetical protein [Paenibacillus taiwanensis]|uniref:hypothetical protein n=1 Tax=Paenibacillus taiwanensis TaxID=401638 RepID=UPI000405C39B|nr:hypothetical protein [Paenibacillus taiwanensis]